MKLNTRAMAFAVAIVWGGAVLVTGLANLMWPAYAFGFLKLLASIYPGYKASGSLGDWVAGELYALVDGAIFGFVAAWLYNRFSGHQAAETDVRKETGVEYSPVEPPSAS